MFKVDRCSFWGGDLLIRVVRGWEKCSIYRSVHSEEVFKETVFTVVNCHPVIINQLLVKHNALGVSLLNEYVTDRNTCLERWGTRKEDVIKIIYSDTNPKPFFEKIHKQIYQELVPALKRDNKPLFNRVKNERNKANKKYNYDGAFLALYLQNVENNILMVMFDYLRNKGYTIGALMFDGLMTEKGEESVASEFPQLEELIFQQTGFRVFLTLKSTETIWEPETLIEHVVFEDNENSADGEDYKVSKNKQLYHDCFSEDGSINFESVKELTSYINKFVCKINYPHAYGWRNNTNDLFDMRTSDKVADRIRFGFLQPAGVCWKNQDDAITYNRFVFEVDFTKVKKDEYNLYRRPKMTEAPKDDVLGLLFFDYLKRVLSNGDNQIYSYFLHYIAKMVQKGKTKQTIVLKGLKGTGKSTFPECLSMIIGREYYDVVRDINQLTSHFNALSERMIITQVEEVVGNGAEYHRVQNILKTLTTEENIRIEKKGIDPYITKSHNNFILLTNHSNPVKITQDNRRNLIVRVSNCERNNHDYFKKLRTELIENIEKIRHFFFSFEFNDDLNSIRPTTEAELELLELNKSAEEQFIEERLVLDGEETHWCRNYQYIYNKYKDFCVEIRKKALPQNYFSQALKEAGYMINRITHDNVKTRFIQGFTPERGIEELAEFEP